MYRFRYFSPQIRGDKALTLNLLKKSTTIEIYCRKIICLKDLTVTAFQISSLVMYEICSKPRRGSSWYIQKVLVMYKNLAA